MLLHLLSLLYQELPVLVGKICVVAFLVCILSCFFESYIVCVMCSFLPPPSLLFFLLLSLTSHFAFLSSPPPSLSLSLSPSTCTSWSFPPSLPSPKPCPFVLLRLEIIIIQLLYNIMIFPYTAQYDLHAHTCVLYYQFLLASPPLLSSFLFPCYLPIHRALLFTIIKYLYNMSYTYMYFLYQYNHSHIHIMTHKYMYIYMY